MYYEINVAYHGKHLFATHQRSCRDSFSAEALYRIFAEKFPATDGYSIDVTEYISLGKSVSF